MKKLIAGTLLAAVGGIAFAQAPAPADNVPAAPDAANFQKLDTNHDGALSKIEASSDSTLTSRFTTADKNSDGKLDAMEYRAALSTRSNPSPVN